MHVAKILKGNQAKDASWPENVGNVLWNGCLHFSFGSSINIHTKKVQFCFESAPQDAAMLVHFLQSKRRKRLDCDVVWCISVLCTGFKNDVTDTDCRPQNGGTYGCVLGNFNKQGQKSCEILLCTGCCFYSILSERAHDASSAWFPFNRVPTCRQLHHHHHSTNQPYLPFLFFSLTAACHTATSTFMQLNCHSTNQPYLPFLFFSLTAACHTPTSTFTLLNCHSTNQPYLTVFFFPLTALCHTATSTFTLLNCHSTNQPYLPFLFTLTAVGYTATSTCIIIQSSNWTYQFSSCPLRLYATHHTSTCILPQTIYTCQWRNWYLFNSAQLQQRQEILQHYLGSTNLGNSPLGHQFCPGAFPFNTATLWHFCLLILFKHTPCINNKSDQILFSLKCVKGPLGLFWGVIWTSPILRKKYQISKLYIF